MFTRPFYGIEVQTPWIASILSRSSRAFYAIRVPLSCGFHGYDAPVSVHSTRFVDSDTYKAGAWTNQERRAALDKAINDPNAAYIIPIQMEALQLPGLSNSIAYLQSDVGAA